MVRAKKWLCIANISVKPLLTTDSNSQTHIQIVYNYSYAKRQHKGNADEVPLQTDCLCDVEENRFNEMPK